MATSASLAGIAAYPQPRFADSVLEGSLELLPGRGVRREEGSRFLAGAKRHLNAPELNRPQE